MVEDVTLHSRVLMHYSIALTDGTMIESSFDDEPVEIQMGQEELPEGMQLAIYGLKVGDTQTLTLTPEQCYGEREADNTHHIPLEDFPDNLPPEVGLTYAFGTEDGGDVIGTIRSIKDGIVEVDFNHPLAGQSLIFTVEILDIDNTHEQQPFDD